MKRRWVILILILVSILVLPMVVLSLGMGMRAFHVPSGAMEDTLLPGDYILASMRAYPERGPGPQPGDIIVWRPECEEQDWIKRCVAVEGELVEIRDGVLYRDGEAIEEPYVKFMFGSSPPPWIAPRNWGPFAVPEGMILLLGDNRDNSRDGRFFGFHAWRETPRGKVYRIYWSWDPGAGRPRWDRLGKVPR